MVAGHDARFYFQPVEYAIGIIAEGQAAALGENKKGQGQYYICEEIFDRLLVNVRALPTEGDLNPPLLEGHGRCLIPFHVFQPIIYHSNPLLQSNLSFPSRGIQFTDIH